MTIADPRALTVPALWRGPLHDWELALRAAGRSPETITTRTDHIRRAARALGGDPREVSLAALLAWVGGQVWARETRRSVYASLRSWWRYLGRDDLAAALPPVRPSDPQPRPAPDNVIRVARAVSDERAELIVRCGAEAGMRRAEIAQVHASDLARDLLGWSLTVHGKGNKDRMVPISDGLAAAIRAACEVGGGWMLPGRIGGHLSARRVGEIAADALPDRWTAHALRHRYATTIYAATGDLIAVQRLLGHASVATTQRYVATDAARLRAAALTAA